MVLLQELPNLGWRELEIVITQTSQLLTGHQLYHREPQPCGPAGQYDVTVLRQVTKQEPEERGEVVALPNKVEIVYDHSKVLGNYLPYLIGQGPDDGSHAVSPRAFL